MPALVQREIAATGVGVCVVFLKTIFDVVGLGLHGHPNAHANVIGNLAPIGFQRGDHFDHAFTLEQTAIADWASDKWNIFHAGWWIQ